MFTSASHFFAPSQDRLPVDKSRQQELLRVRSGSRNDACTEYDRSCGGRTPVPLALGSVGGWQQGAVGCGGGGFAGGVGPRRGAWLVPATVTCQVGRAVEDLVALRASAETG